ncbi:MAG TPA: M23 family metallopeptidase, partial [Candidatus Dormibacteraeota bacterium]|nr:M23 family metallopeptidase [Candidatus Dormibacteraeota bacterium]
MPGAWRRRAGAVAATLVVLAAARPALADVSPSPAAPPPAAPMAFPLGAGPDPIGPGAVVPPRPRCALTWPLPRLVVPLSWVDHHYPTRQADGVVVRYDGVENVNYDGHRGLDLPVAAGTTALAAADGVVVYAGWDDAGGYGVGLEHDGCRTFYFHNSGLLVHVGDAVRRGQVISLTGSTGNSTGPHLHFEVRDL